MEDKNIAKPQKISVELQDGQEVLENKFKIVKKLGEGNFADIFQVEKKETGDQLVAKIQRANENEQHILLFWEGKLIHKLKGKTAVANLHGLGDQTTEDGKKYHVMVMDQLGKSLQDHFEECNKKFDLTTTLLIGSQMVKIMEVVHQEGIIHRDLKPANFLVGPNDATKNTIHIIDFDISKFYKADDGAGEHIPFKEGINITKSQTMTSLNAQLGYEQSRRDDLETIALVMLYFLKGSLPWLGLDAESPEALEAAIKKKWTETTIDELCEGQPAEIKEFMNYCRGLEFTADPDYVYLTGLIETCMKSNSIDPTTADFMWNKN